MTMFCAGLSNVQAKVFIEPDLKTGHIKITNKFNPFTEFQSPTYIRNARILKVHTTSGFLSWKIIALKRNDFIKIMNKKLNKEKGLI